MNGVFRFCQNLKLSNGFFQNIDKSSWKIIYCYLSQKVVEDARNRNSDKMGKALQFMRKYSFFSKRNPFFGFSPNSVPNGGLDEELSLLAQKLRDILITRKKSLYGANNR